MIQRVAAKAHKDMVVTDILGVKHYIKILNFVYSGTRQNKLDRQAVCAPESELTAGHIFYLPSGECYTVVNKVPDYYRGKMIRHNLDLFENNNTVTVVGQAVTRTPQGGVINHASTPRFTSIPCKALNIYSKDDRELDVELGRFTVMLSTKYQVKLGDRLSFGSIYGECKVKLIKRNQPGIQEILFDEDPRWL